MRFALLLTLFAFSTYYLLDLEMQLKSLIAIGMAYFAEIIAMLKDINDNIKNKKP